MKIGILTGGGDCPGLNAAIRAVVRRAAQYDYEVIGIRNGWAGLLGDGSFMALDPKSVAGNMQVGGTILGAGRANPFRRDLAVDEAIQRLKASGDAALNPAIEYNANVLAWAYPIGLGKSLVDRRAMYVARLRCSPATKV
mgnify:CR=1 FL=1